MKNKKSIAVIIMLALFSVSMMISCTHNPQNQPVPEVSFSSSILPIFTASCVLNSSCHLGANGINQDIDLDSSVAYATIIAKGLVSTSNPSSSLLYAEVNSNEMPKPPSAPLSASQQALILEWIQQGAKNN